MSTPSSWVVIAIHLQKWQSTSTSINMQRDSIIPASKISNHTQGVFVGGGAVSDNFDERIAQNIFHCKIVVDNGKVKRETAKYKPIPTIVDFTDKQGNDIMEQETQANYNRVKHDIVSIVEQEIERIKSDPGLRHLVKE